MKRILVPTDFSNNAYAALFYATRLFQDQTCQFYILNTYEVNTPVLTSRIDTSKGDLLYQKLRTESNEKLLETYHTITRDSEKLNHSFETISVSKNLVETINNTIKNKNIDLVVMGTKGATGAKQFFMGSNTVKIIQKIKKCPVLIIPGEYQFEKPLEIAFPTGFGRFYMEEELIPLASIARLFGSKIKIFHIHEKEHLDELQEYNFDALKKYLRDFNQSVHWIPEFNQKSKLINDFIENMNINMLAMVNYKHSLIESITHEPVIKNIGFHPTIPFLVIPDVS